MKIVLNREDREQAYKSYVLDRLAIACNPDELVVTMPTYSDGTVSGEIVKKSQEEAEAAPASIDRTV